MPIVDWFARAFGELIADVRHKVVEEPWFGRAVTPAPLTQPQVQSLAEGLGWAQGGSASSRVAPEPNEREHSIER